LAYQQIAVRAGVILLGAILFIGAIRQWVTGETTGREGRIEKGRWVVRRSEMPRYFTFLMVVRFVLGTASLLLGLFFWRT